MANISPGVYVKIIDNSEFINEVPSITMFVPFFSDKGIDNKLVFLNGTKTLLTKFKVDNILNQGKEFREGYLCLKNWLAISGSAYGMRVLPPDATYSNILVSLKLDPTNNYWIISLENVTGVQTKAEIETIVNTTSTTSKPLYMLYGIGRGEYYDKVSVNFVDAVNADDQYYIDIYLDDADGSAVMAESRLISFKEDMVDDTGESIYLKDVLSFYSDLIYAKMNDTNIIEYLNAAFNSIPIEVLYELSDPAGHTVINNMGYWTGENPSGAFSGHVNEVAVYDGSNWSFTDIVRGAAFKYANAISVVTDPSTLTLDENNHLDRYYVGSGATGAFAGQDGKVAVYHQAFDYLTPEWTFEDMSSYMFDGDTLNPFDRFTSIYSAANSNDSDIKHLNEGSQGSLMNSVTGRIDSSIATQYLVKSYNGEIDSKVINTEFVYFPFTFCPYPKDVKDAAQAMAQYIRRDTIIITDVGDNNSPDVDILRRQNEFAYNTYFVALYGNYTRVYNSDIGKDIWVSPCYHMSTVIPYTETIAELWSAPAGIARASLPNVKEARYEPELGDRDNLYRAQINPIVHFREGFIVWGQLTSQTKASSLQDINVVVTILYIKKALKQYCRNYVFENNVQEERDKIYNTVDEFLKSIKDDGGLLKYSLEVVDDDYHYKRKIVPVNVILWPTKIIEKIELNLFVR